MFEEEGLVRVEHHAPDCCCCALIEKTDDCACNSRDGLAVCGPAFLCRDDTAHVGHIAFRLPSDHPTTALLWLLCNHFKFYTYSTRIEGGSLRRGLIEATKKLFARRVRLSCQQCIEYVARSDVKPLYFLQNIVLSNDKKGPTIESVL